MFDHNHYVPVLKWRMGEYQALMRLGELVKDWVTPLFEIPTEGWNFETEAPLRSLDDHLAGFGEKLFSKWGTRTCFIDSPYLDGASVLSTGVHHMQHIFLQAKQAGCSAIPVIGLQRHPAYLGAVQFIVGSTQNGVCVRLERDDFGPGLQSTLQSLIQALAIPVRYVDLVVDLEASISEVLPIQVSTWSTCLSQVSVTPWRTLTLVGTSFPRALGADQYRPHGRTPRSEWLAYKELVRQLAASARKPTFGDYATSSPNTGELDPRMVDPNAKIKYTLSDEWIVHVGKQVKRFGRGQYQAMCQGIINANPPYFTGPGYSWGDAYIHGCALGSEGTGGPSTWPSVATNHHVTKAVRDVASFHGTSAPP
ncbi:beta family protein [Variovorax sp. 350MFTsu5.1]|uniref:beta family protein n=1 Tax=Variovorax sp. 350MFTsu5.1 TaxID=3158365 RepID=UPI003AAA4D5E